MSAPPRKPRPSPEQCRALELLAGSRYGVNEELLVYGHGFTRRMLAGLVGTGLATGRCEVIMAGAKTIEVCKVRITAMGRRAIEGASESE